MEFKNFSSAVAKQFQKMSKGKLFRVSVEGDYLWETYLGSFPEGTNPVFRERTEHDCSACRSFIKRAGALVGISPDGKDIVTIWDVKIPGEPAYQAVADALAAIVREGFATGGIDNIFLSTEKSIGTEKNKELLPDQSVLTWTHFFVNLPNSAVVGGRLRGVMTFNSHLSHIRSTKDVFLRGLRELTADALEVVQELISQKSLYKGTENEHVITRFLKLKREFSQLNEQEQELFAWAKFDSVPEAVARARNTAIGQLLINLSEGMDLEKAVKAYEKIVAPENYRRTTALVTKSMIARAEKTLQELGFMSALDRRYAVIEDISINDVLWADRQAKKQMNVFDELAAEVPDRVPKMDRVETIPIEDFIRDVLPKVETMEVMVENRHVPNFTSLIAPSDPTARPMFQWDNNFCWGYEGDVTDAIKERVKAAGGDVTGHLRASLSWSNHDDLDIHMHEPGRSRIYYSSPRSVTGGNLDVDMNAGGRRSREPVENITYPTRSRMRDGRYKVVVNQYQRRENTNLGFTVELEIGGEIRTFHYAKGQRTGEDVTVIEFEYGAKTPFKIIKSLPSEQASKTVWGVPTQSFRRVETMLYSPNHWGGNGGVGHKHYMFMLDGCLQEGRARGFFNEFLRPELREHRKVFEMVGARMKVPESDRQLSGLGFSSDRRNKLLCRLRGKFSRDVQLTF